MTRLPTMAAAAVAAVLFSGGGGFGIAQSSSSSRAEARDERLAKAQQAASARLRHLVETRNTPGVSGAAVVDGRVVWSEGFGFANLEHQVPATAATRFGLGSLSKTLTVAGMMTLVDEGLLDLDAPVERYLPDFPHRGKGITLRRLAAHQSGLSDAFATAHNWTTEHFDTIDSAYRRIKNDPLATTPGTALAYATGTFTIIGRVMELATQRTYGDVMRTNVIDRIGLRSIVPNDPRRIIPHRTGFYMKTEAGQFEHGAHFNPSFKLPGAGFLGSAPDVALFGAALLSGELLNERARHEMFASVALRDGTSTEYALGLRVGEHRGRAMLHLPGGGIGISSWLYLYPAEKLSIALLSNVSTGAMGGTTHDLIATAFLETLAARRN